MNLTKEEFTKKLESLRTDKGVRMGSIFKLAKEYMHMPLSEVEKLLDSSAHEIRVGAVSIMDFQARDKKISKEQKKEVFDLYIKKHDRINTWDLVDRSAIYVVGSYLLDKPRDILYKLAKSDLMADRRTAVVSTFYFIKNKQYKDTIKIAEVLLNDKEDLVHKAVGWALRTIDVKELIKFLDKHAKQMPRVMLRYSIEKLSIGQKTHYMSLKKAN
ncbi:MAG: DNA alkylation repair protein [Candidatus Dojkabacteria bacterium]